MSPGRRKRREAAALELAKVTAERDQLQAVLGDLLKERGLEPQLIKLRAAIGAVRWLMQRDAWRVSDHAHLLKLLDTAHGLVPLPSRDLPGEEDQLRTLSGQRPQPLGPWTPGAPPGHYRITSEQAARLPGFLPRLLP